MNLYIINMIKNKISILYMPYPYLGRKQKVQFQSTDSFTLFFYRIGLSSLL